MTAYQTKLQEYFDEGAKLQSEIMEQLKKVDPVAYVRFASVYREFEDVNTFMAEINKLISQKEQA